MRRLAEIAEHERIFEKRRNLRDLLARQLRFRFVRALRLLRIAGFFRRIGFLRARRFLRIVQEAFRQRGAHRRKFRIVPQREQMVGGARGGGRRSPPDQVEHGIRRQLRRFERRLQERGRGLLRLRGSNLRLSRNSYAEKSRAREKQQGETNRLVAETRWVTHGILRRPRFAWLAAQRIRNSCGLARVSSQRNPKVRREKEKSGDRFPEPATWRRDISRGMGRGLRDARYFHQIRLRLKTSRNAPSRISRRAQDGFVEVGVAAAGAAAPLSFGVAR